MAGDSPNVDSYRVGENESTIDNHERRITNLEKFKERTIGALTVLSLALGAWGFVEFVIVSF